MAKVHNPYRGPSAARKRAIAELAEIVGEERTVPIDPHSIARDRGITISYGHYQQAFDGLLEHRAGRFHIYCNIDRLERPERPRARFTVAHELGHFFIEDHCLALRSGRSPAHPSFTEYESLNPAEVEADHFATNLLMPTERFLGFAKKQEPGIPGILSLSREFGTSVTSTAIRYATIEVRPCLVVKWSPAGYDWKWLSTGIRLANYRKTIEEPSEVVRGSATAMALSGRDPPSQGFFQSGTTASSWFPFVPEAARRNIILIEQAIPLGRFGVLTFVYPESGDLLPDPV